MKLEPRQCSKCGVLKAVTEFYTQKRKDGSHRPNPHCKDCHSQALRRNWQSLPAEERRRRGRRSHLGKFGLTVDDFEQLEQRADGRCEICGRAESSVTYNDRARGLAIDHDHETGRVRGLLCFICNTRLGWLEQVGIEQVLGYLKGSSCASS